MSMPPLTDGPRSFAGLLADRNSMLELLDLFEERRPLPPASGAKLTLAAIVLALVSPAATLIGSGYFKGDEARESRLKSIESEQVVSRKERGDNRSGVERLDRELDQMRKGLDVSQARVDGRFAKLDEALAPVAGLVKESGRHEASIASLEDWLKRGREERLADTAKMLEAIGALKTEVALLRQAIGERPRRPFDQGGAWNAPPYPNMLKAAYRLSGRAR